MRTLTMRRRRAALALVLGVVLAGAVRPDAQRRNRGDNSLHGMPVATNTIARAPERYYGRLVTVSATVEQVVSDAVFVVDQRRMASATSVAPAGAPLLVIAPGLTTPVAANRAFLVRGQVTRLEDALARTAAGRAMDLPPDVAARYRGQPVLLATSVIDATYAELVKAPEPMPSTLAPAGP